LTRILVTGASGFLGRHVVRRLIERGDSVTALTRTANLDGIETLHADLAESDQADRVLQPWRWDAVVNLAGPVTSGNEQLSVGIDVVATHVRIALLLRRHAAQVRIVHASSMTVYGVPERVDVDEEHPRRPRHLYGLAKVLAEDVFLADPTLDVWILRLPGLFSEERKTGALYHFCQAARAGQPLRVSNQTPTPWSVLHVADAAESVMLALAARSQAGGPLNVSYDEPVELVAVATMIARHANTGSGVERVHQVEHPSLHLVGTKARVLLGWTAPSLTTRLHKLYSDYATT
jgi:UDP-glucose 4-epimerase